MMQKLDCGCLVDVPERYQTTFTNTYAPEKYLRYCAKHKPKPLPQQVKILNPIGKIIGNDMIIKVDNITITIHKD